MPFETTYCNFDYLSSFVVKSYREIDALFETEKQNPQIYG